MDFQIVVQDNLVLKIRRSEDADAIFSVVDKNRTYLGTWMPWVKDTLTVDDTRGYIEEQRKNFENKTAADFGVWYEGQWVGSMGFHHINTSDKKAAIGYWLAEEFTGKGIMTQCVKAVIAYGFKDLGLNRIEIECSTENKKSQAIPERLGFTKEGLLRQSHIVNGATHDNYLYSLLREEWKE